MHMKDEYDFSKGVRGKFFRKDAKLKLPGDLSTTLQAILNQSRQSLKEGKGLSRDELWKRIKARHQGKKR